MKLSIKQINSLKRITLLLVLATMLPAVASAKKTYDFCWVDGLRYYIDFEDKVAIVIPENESLLGNHHYGYEYAYNNLNGNIVIPDNIVYKKKEYPVVAIYPACFSRCYGLTSVTIPNTVTEIGAYAFYSCSGLTSITIPNSVTEIGEKAFEHCGGLTSVTIGNSVTKIGSEAFPDYNNHINEVNISDIAAWCNIIFDDNPLTGADLYLNGTKITDLDIPNTVTKINASAFSGCRSLTSVTIPSSVSSIGGNAFSGCTGLTSVTIPNSVTSIGERAFSGCTGLTSVTIPSSVTSIGDGVFNNCTNLTAVHCESRDPAIFQNPSFEKSIVFYMPSECVEIYRAAWKNATIVEEGNSDVLGPGREFVQNGFKCHVNDDGQTLTVCGPEKSKEDIKGNLVIPESVTYESVTCKVTTIDNYAFRGYTGLTSVIIPNSVTKIGWEAFEDCTGLTSVTIGNSVTKISNSAFSGCTGLISVTIPNSVTDIGAWAFENCCGLTSVTIGNSVTEIGKYAFSGCIGLKSITFGNSLTTIGDYAFNRCTGLTSIILPNSVTDIGAWAFENCSGLTSVTLPNSVTKIGYCAFSGSKNVLVKYNGSKSLRELGWTRFVSDDVSGRAPTTSEINAVGKATFNKLKQGIITRGMKFSAIDKYDDITDYEADGDYLYDCMRISTFTRNSTHNDTSYYTIGFYGGYRYYVIVRNGVITSVSY